MKKYVVLGLAALAFIGGVISITRQPKEKAAAPFTKIVSTITITPAQGMINTPEESESASGTQTASPSPTLVPPGTQTITIADATLGQEKVSMTATADGMSPNVIKVKVRQTLRLEIKSTDAAYAFALKDLNVFAALMPGKTLILEVVPDRAGTFPFECIDKCDGATDLGAELSVE